jgi:hypothetical protein
MKLPVRKKGDKCEFVMGTGCGCIQKRLDKKQSFVNVWDELGISLTVPAEESLVPENEQ